MLRSIAMFSMQGRWYAASAVALFSMISLILPPLSWLAGGVIVLSTLRLGPAEGVKIVAATAIILGLLAALLLKNIAILGLLLLSSCLPTFLVALVLGYTRSLAASFLIATALGILVVLTVYVVLPDPVAWWQQTIMHFMEQVNRQFGRQIYSVQTQKIAMDMSLMMTGIVAAGGSLNLMLGLLIGRRWQVMLYNTGDFVNEFYQLRFGKTAAIAMITWLAITLLLSGDQFLLLQDCLPVLLILFAFQGLSVVHAIVNKRGKWSFWLVIVYILLVIMLPQMVVLLATIGILDQWLNFRQYA